MSNYNRNPDYNKNQENIQVGDVVTFISENMRFSSYKRWFNENVNSDFEFGLRIHLGTDYKVVTVAEHFDDPNRYGVLLAIAEEKGNKVAIVGTDAVKLKTRATDSTKDEDGTLYDNKWLRVVQKNGYVYSQLPWCNSTGVAILPFRKVWENDNYRLEYLAVYEKVVSHGDGLKLGCITGGMDKQGKSLQQVALEELREEGGVYLIKQLESRLLNLGHVRPNKASDVTTFLFGIEIRSNDVYTGVSSGDGTVSEVGMFPAWITEEQAILSEDPVLATMISRLKLRGI